MVLVKKCRVAQCQPCIAGTFIAKVVKGEQVLLKKGNRALPWWSKFVCLANRQKHQNLVVNANYWSSTENNATNAFNFNFNNGNTNNNNKTNTYSVRAVRDSSTKIYQALPYFGLVVLFNLKKDATFIIRYT